MLEFVLLRTPIEPVATSQLPIRIMKYSLAIVQVLRTFSVAAAFQLFAGKEISLTGVCWGCGQTKFHHASLFCLSSCGTCT